MKHYVPESLRLALLRNFGGGAETVLQDVYGILDVNYVGIYPACRTEALALRNAAFGRRGLLPIPKKLDSLAEALLDGAMGPVPLPDKPGCLPLVIVTGEVAIEPRPLWYEAAYRLDVIEVPEDLMERMDYGFIRTPGQLVGRAIERQSELEQIFRSAFSKLAQRWFSF